MDYLIGYKDYKDSDSLNMECFPPNHDPLVSGRLMENADILEIPGIMYDVMFTF